MKLKLATLTIAIAFTGSAVAAKSFDTLDANGNGQLTKDEFYGSVSDAGVYADWDADSDGLIDEEEFEEIGADWDYDTWDGNSDGYVDSGEFYDSYYASYDTNEDGHWNSGEWDDAGEAGLFDW